MFTKLPLDASDPGWPATVRGHVAQVEASAGPAVAIGLAAPGIARPDGHAVGWMQGRLGELEGLDWTSFLGRRDLVPVLQLTGLAELLYALGMFTGLLVGR